MAQTNYTPIQLYSSSTATNTPLAANLAAGELAINTADGILFYKDSSNVVQKIGYKLTPTTAGGTGLTSFTNGGIVYASSTSALATGSALTWNGTNLAVTGTLSTTGTITSTAVGTILTRSGASTSQQVLQLANTSGNAILGVESSTGASLLTGGTAYATFLSSFTATPVQIGVNGAVVSTFSSTGLGIGTSSPTDRLDIRFASGTGNLKAGVIAGNNIKIYNTVGDLALSSSDATSDVYLDSQRNVYFKTANTQRMTLDASGNLGIGATSIPSYTRLQVTGTAGAQTDAKQQITISAPTTTVGEGAGIRINAASGAKEAVGIIGVVNNASGNLGSMTFGVYNGGATVPEYMRLDSSGNLLVGTTSYGGSANVAGFGANPVGQIAVERNGGAAGVFNRFSSDGQLLIFRRQGTTVGSIDVTTTATSYLTSSDYRLKNTIAPMTGALAKVAALKPVTYKWNVDGSDGQGFIAHELAEVVPQCVTGEKDGVDAEGNPQYQGIDTSFLVATLTAAIQELKAEFDAYKASHP